MRGAPQPGFSRLIRRISSRISRDTAGRPGLASQDFPGPEPSKCLTMPGNDGLGLEDLQRGAPFRPVVRKNVIGQSNQLNSRETIAKW